MANQNLSFSWSTPVPDKVPGLKDTHLYETSLEVTGLATTPFILESLPDSFRYDRRIPAYGINVGVEVRA